MVTPVVPDPLSGAEVQRYSRQLLLPAVGVDGQLALKRTRILIVGLGGLGCPAALYLGGAGIGTLGLVDVPGEAVAVSNLHRQIAHTTAGAAAGAHKTTSLRLAVRALNPHVNVVLHEAFTPATAVALCAAYDVILDCTDNVATRYLASDACAAARVPLVSGAALGTDGQVTVLCGGASANTPCYRCVFPSPPPPTCVGACDSAGVLGPVTGVIGSLMALEAMKLVGIERATTLAGRLLLFDGLRAEFRTVKLRPRVEYCIACGVSPKLNVVDFDYAKFANAGAHPKPTIDDELRIDVHELDKLRREESSFLLLDVRPAAEYRMCSLRGSVSVPLDKLSSDKARELVSEHSRMVVLCRRGNKSQAATLRLLEAGAQNVVDVRGGLQAWHREVDDGFPLY